LIPLLLWQEGVLREPLLYLSLYLKNHRSRYYELLDVVRRDGDWEGWLEFFLEGARETASGAVATAERLVSLFRLDRAAIEAMGRRAGSALRVQEALKVRPICTLAEVSRLSGLSFPTATAAMEGLVHLGVARELTGRRRNRLFVYDRLLAILNEGLEVG
jgi:Fic family protein